MPCSKRESTNVAAKKGRGRPRKVADDKMVTTTTKRKRSPSEKKAVAKKTKKQIDEEDRKYKSHDKQKNKRRPPNARNLFMKEIVIPSEGDDVVVEALKAGRYGNEPVTNYKEVRSAIFKAHGNAFNALSDVEKRPYQIKAAYLKDVADQYGYADKEKVDERRKITAEMLAAFEKLSEAQRKAYETKTQPAAEKKLNEAQQQRKPFGTKVQPKKKALPNTAAAARY